ncbi:MAG: glycosyltransferase [Caldilineaceae bacterium]
MIAPLLHRRCHARVGITGKIVVVLNGIELEQFHTHTGTVQRADLGIADNAVVGIYVGRMSGEKSVDRLISIFAALIDEAPMLHLLFVGAIALDEYKELVHALGIEQAVTFTGAVDYARIADYLALADFFRVRQRDGGASTHVYRRSRAACRGDRGHRASVR